MIYFYLQFAQIHQEPKNKELLNLLNRERALNSISPITQISYRHQAQSILEEGEGELYRAEWVSCIIFFLLTSFTLLAT